MGGAGSGGHKKSAGDVETHSAWLLTPPAMAPAPLADTSTLDTAVDPNTPTPNTNPRSSTASSAHKLPQATCKFCSKEMAQHTSRQRSHLLICAPYLDAMREMGVENSITRQAADPGAFARERSEQQTAQGRKSDAAAGGKPKARAAAGKAKGPKRTRKSATGQGQGQSDEHALQVLPCCYANTSA